MFCTVCWMFCRAGLYLLFCCWCILPFTRLINNPQLSQPSPLHSQTKSKPKLYRFVKNCLNFIVIRLSYGLQIRIPLYIAKRSSDFLQYMNNELHIRQHRHFTSFFYPRLTKLLTPFFSKILLTPKLLWLFANCVVTT